MTAYKMTILPAKDFKTITIICPGCKAKTITDLQARPVNTRIIGPCCGSCGMEFDDHVEKVMENFVKLVEEIKRGGKFTFEFPLTQVADGDFGAL